MKYVILTMLLTGILLCACATQSSTSGLSKAALGYLSINGNFERREILIDGTNVGVDPEEDNLRVSLKPGKHMLEVRSANRVLLSQEVEIIPGQTVQITAP